MGSEFVSHSSPSAPRTPPRPAAANRFYAEFDFAKKGGGSQREDEYRSAFQIDRDRIIHTSAFRRLQSKTQVFLSGEYDFYRTRLTHSIEVAQIGRSICASLNTRSELLGGDYFIDSDLVEAACLAQVSVSSTPRPPESRARLVLLALLGRNKAPLQQGQQPPWAR